MKTPQAKNILEIIVTNEELWIKSPLIFAGLLDQFGLLYKLNLENVKSVNLENHYLKLIIKPKRGLTKEILLNLRNPEKFIEVINQRTSREF